MAKSSKYKWPKVFGELFVCAKFKWPTGDMFKNPK